MSAPTHYHVFKTTTIGAGLRRSVCSECGLITIGLTEEGPRAGLASLPSTAQNPLRRKMGRRARRVLAKVS